MSENSIAQTDATQAERWAFSFGHGQTHPDTGENLLDAYVVIPGEFDEARTKMVQAFGDRWSFPYSTEQIAKVAPQFNMREIPMRPAPPAAACGCPVRWAGDIRRDPADTLVEHVDGCTEAESKIWACPEPGCGHHIADGPTAVGEPSTDELISEHMEEHAPGIAAPIESLDPLDEWPQPDVSDVLAIDDAVELVDELPEPETERAAYTRGLREIADWLDANPEIQLPYLDSTISGKDQPTLNILLGWWSGKDQREQMATIGRAMGKFDKYARPDGDRFAISRVFGSIALTVTADRDEVCERIVVGTREVTEEVPDPEAVAALPKVSVTKVVEDVRWECRSILADEPNSDAAVA